MWSLSPETTAGTGAPVSVKLSKKTRGNHYVPHFRYMVNPGKILLTFNNFITGNSDKNHPALNSQNE